MPLNTFQFHPHCTQGITQHLRQAQPGNPLPAGHLPRCAVQCLLPPPAAGGSKRGGRCQRPAAGEGHRSGRPRSRGRPAGEEVQEGVGCQAVGRWRDRMPPPTLRARIGTVGPSRTKECKGVGGWLPLGANTPPRCAPSPSHNSRPRNPARCWTFPARIYRSAGQEEAQPGEGAGHVQHCSRHASEQPHTMRSKGMLAGCVRFNRVYDT